MNNCPNCGSNVSQGEAFCRNCGTKIPLTQNNLQNNPQQLEQSNNQNVGGQTTNSGFGLQDNSQPQNSPQQLGQDLNQNVGNQPINSGVGLQDNSQPQNNPQQLNQNVNQNMGVQQANSNVGMQGTVQPQNNSYGMPQNGFANNDSDLIDAYIGKNADKLKNTGFSVNTFLFGFIYVLYRKMWLLGFLWLAVSFIATNFLSSIAYYIGIAANIIISTQFKKLYLNHVQEEVNKIKSTNPGASKEQLMLLCSKKGGTTIVPVIIIVVLYTILIVIAIAAATLVMNATKDKVQQMQDNAKTSDIIGNLHVEVPYILREKDYSTDAYKIYQTSDSKDSCILKITTVNAGNTDVKQYLDKNIYRSSTDTFSGISVKPINNKSWYYASVKTTSNQNYYYYAIADGGKIYKLDFSISNDTNGKCSSAHDTVINSLEFD